MPKSMLENYKARSKRVRAERRALIKEILGDKCAICGSQDPLEADHKDPASKIKDIASLLTHKESTFRQELLKCQLLCKACHIAKTIADNYTNPRQHGTYLMYNKGKCRCDLCAEARREYRRGYDQRKKV